MTSIELPHTYTDSREDRIILGAWGTDCTATELIRALPLLPEDEETR